MVSEPGKPLPQDVLRTLTNGFEFEVKLMELCVIDAENSSPCTRFENQTPFSQSMRSLTDLGNVVGFGHTNPKNNTTETPELSKASDAIGVLPSQESPCEQDELQISDVAGPSQLKVISYLIIPFGFEQNFHFLDPMIYFGYGTRLECESCWEHVEFLLDSLILNFLPFAFPS